MSYLDSAGIIFTGDFFSDVSTVNNDVRHYDNATFEKRFQDPQVGNVLNGWWNPSGGAVFRFDNCNVARCIDANGVDLPASQLLGAIVTDAKGKSPGKMVDLDPQMQMSSEIFGTELRMTDAEGNLLFRGDLVVTGFRDLQTRQFNTRGIPDSNPNGQPLGGNFYTILENVVWGEHAGQYPILTTLRDNSDPGFLGLTMNTFGYYYSHADGRFAMGKVMGTLFPWQNTQPIRFAATRRVYGAIGLYMNYSNFGINETFLKLSLDLGMCIPITGPMGEVHGNFTRFTIAIANNVNVNIPACNINIPACGNQKYSISPDQYIEIGQVNITDPVSWLDQTGGIVILELSTDQLEALRDQQLLILKEEGGDQVIYGRESIGGYDIRPDYNVFRLDPGNTLDSQIYIYRWGVPQEGMTATITLDDPQGGVGGGSKSDPDPPTAPIPVINVPAGKVILSDGPYVTNASGIAAVSLTGTDPENPRGYVDGQIYQYSLGISGVENVDQYWNNKLLVHLRNAFPLIDEPTWDDVREIWVEYGNLYPIMSNYIMDFYVQQDILAHRKILLFAFSLDINDPDYMPAIRDMSANKLQTLINWLNTASEPEAVLAAERTMTEKSAAPLTVEEATQPEDLVSAMTKLKGGNLEVLRSKFLNPQLEDTITPISDLTSHD